MKRITRVLTLLTLLVFNRSDAQKARGSYSLKLYVPVSFNTANYQLGTYTWGNWNVQGIEVGLNLKKKRIEQELLLASPSLSHSTYWKQSPSDTNTDYYQEDFIQTTLGLRYQASYELWKGAKEKFRILPGLGIALNSSFAKTVSYESGYGFIEDKMQFVLIRPYIHTSFNYALNAHWGMDATFMFSPMLGMYARIKNFYPSGSYSVLSDWLSNDQPVSTIFSRIGVSYRF